MPFPYKRVLLVGATSGIGAAMADKLILEGGAKVIAVGRRQERLDAFVQKHGPDKASAVRYDITDTAGLDAFVQGIVSTYPDLDCVFLNSGTQNMTRLSRPDEVDLAAFHAVMDTNFSRVVDLAVRFLPHLLAKGGRSEPSTSPTALIITGTLLALVPAVTMPAYSASKAALNAFVYCLRRQLRGSGTKVIEIWPPAVQTELHDYMGVEIGRAVGMPLDEFMEQAWPQLAAGSEDVVVGNMGPDPEAYRKLMEGRRDQFESLSDAMLARFPL